MIASVKNSESALWDELIPVLGNQPSSLMESFTKAVGAVGEARQGGYINDDEVAVLFGEMAAIFVGAKLQDIMLQAFTGPMGIASVSPRLVSRRGRFIPTR